MGVLHEFRIPVPLTADEFQRGQLYMTARVSSEATVGDEGIEWLANAPYDNTDGMAPPSRFTGTPVPRDSGQYTLKRLLLRSKVPALVRHLVPANALWLLEEAWNAYPHCTTTLVNGYLDHARFRIVVETLHVDGDAELDNALSLAPDELARRRVEYVDVRSAAAHAPGHKDYKAAEDVTRFTSAATGRGPLVGDRWWARLAPPTPLMCAYKLVRADFKYFGLQGAVESIVLSSQRELFAASHARAVCSMDEWLPLSMADVRRLEEETAAKAAAALDKVVAASASVGGGGAAAPTPGAAR